MAVYTSSASAVRGINDCRKHQKFLADTNIRKSKNNEDKPDFKEMWSEVNKNIQEQDAEQDIISRVPELKELSGSIDKATNNCVNATLQCESVIRQYQRAEEKLGNAVDTISGKVVTVNEHIDKVMEDAPTKLKVTVTLCDADWQKIHELHNQWMEQEKQMLAGQRKQQEALWQKHSQRLTDIVKNNEGVWISTRVFYVVGSLSLLSNMTIAMEIAFYVYFHWIQ